MKSIKLAIIALLGFSTACSTVKESSQSKPEKEEEIKVQHPIIVMYGVPRPVETATEIKKAKQPSPDIDKKQTDPNIEEVPTTK